MSDPRCVVVWTISSPSAVIRRGGFCPAGGMSEDEANKAIERLYQTARARGVTPRRDQAGINRENTGISIGAAKVQYTFDVMEAFDGLGLGETS